MLARTAVRMALWVAIGLSFRTACSAGITEAAQPPTSSPALQRYDLPDGTNLPQIMLEEISRTVSLDISRPSEVPIAVRIFGSANYLNDTATGQSDWKAIHDLDAVVYVDRDAHRKIMEREHPEFGEDRIDRRVIGLSSRSAANVGRRLADIAERLQIGGLAVADNIFDVSHFSAVAMDPPAVTGWAPPAPIYGYRPYETTFGNAAGITRLGAYTKELNEQKKLDFITAHYRDVLGDLKNVSSDSKFVKRLIQLAVLRGDEEQRRNLTRLLMTVTGGGLDSDNYLSRVKTEARAVLNSWSHHTHELANALRTFLAKAERGEPFVQVSGIP